MFSSSPGDSSWQLELRLAAQRERLPRSHWYDLPALPLAASSTAWNGASCAWNSAIVHLPVEPVPLPKFGNTGHGPFAKESPSFWPPGLPVLSVLTPTLLSAGVWLPESVLHKHHGDAHRCYLKWKIHVFFKMTVVWVK